MRHTGNTIKWPLNEGDQKKSQPQFLLRKWSTVILSLDVRLQLAADPG